MIDCPLPTLLPHPAAWFSQAAVILSLAGGTFPITAHAEPQRWVCPMLLMDFECAQYHRRLEQSTGAEERCRIEREYRELLEDRQHACRCSEPKETQEAFLRATLPP